MTHDQAFNTLKELFEEKLHIVSLNKVPYLLRAEVSWYVARGCQGQIAVQFKLETGEPWGTLTYADSLFYPEPGMLLVKTWSENVEWADQITDGCPWLEYLSTWPASRFVEGELWQLCPVNPEEAV